jgi:hypothetical protein
MRQYILLLMALTLPLMAGNVTIVQPEPMENSVTADQAHVMNDFFWMCGDLVDGSDAETWFAPAVENYLGDYSASVVIGSAVCDALDSESEDATSNIALAADMPAFKVNGFYCTTQGVALTSPLTFTLRSDGADLTPSLTCTIATGASQGGCAVAAGTTTDVAAGGTMSMRAQYGQNLDATAAACKVFISIK